jgi:LPS export ABC transporter protein LptC
LKGKNRTYTLLHFFLFTFSFFILSCEERIKPSVLGGLNNAELPSHESWGSTITFSDSGQIRAILKVGHLRKFEDSQMTLLDGGLHVDFFDENGHHSSVLTSLEGKVDDRTKDFEAHGNVVVVSDSGTTLQTERLFWKKARRQVNSEEFVKIISPKEEIEGQGFESDENLKDYRIFHVTGKTTMAK